ncbi:glycosyltransferase family 2 protein [Nitriliruptoraceae bacterium ZYF776]|nr:glycosyltransferase family 2 protein [Profundirhabdus halotolerans]
MVTGLAITAATTSGHQRRSASCTSSARTDRTSPTVTATPAPTSSTARTRGEGVRARASAETARRHRGRGVVGSEVGTRARRVDRGGASCPATEGRANLACRHGRRAGARYPLRVAAAVPPSPSPPPPRSLVVHAETPVAVDPVDAAAPADPAAGGVPIEVTVVLPVFNEVEHVRQEIDRIRDGLEASGKTFEILVVDDASTDGSTELLRTIPGIELIVLPRNRGSGYVRRIGTERARGEVVVWTDADMTYPNHEIAALVDHLDDGYDQVVGARTSEKGTHRWARVPAKFLIRKLASYLVQERIPDLNSGFRAFKRSVALPYLHLLPRGFSCVTTITLAFLANAHLVGYVPIEYAERSGRSKFHWRVDTARYIQQVVRMVMTFNPLRVFLPVGGALMAGAFGKLIYDIVTKDGRITTNAVILVVVSFQVIAIGLLADLVTRVMAPRSAAMQLDAAAVAQHRPAAPR